MKYEITRIHTVEITEVITLDREPTAEEKEKAGKCLQNVIKAAASFAKEICPSFNGFDHVETAKTQDFVREVD
jgi:hypothetical protein